MEFIIPQHGQGALSLWAADPEKLRAESADRMERLEALDPERLPMALTFLSGYQPRVFDAILDAVEPCRVPDSTDETPDQELFCLKCDALVGVFPAHGKDYMHYRGVVTATSKPGGSQACDRLAPGRGCPRDDGLAADHRDCRQTDSA